MRNLHREITDKLIARLEAGVVPWRKPWATRKTAAGALSVLPANAVTGKAYNGINILLLWGRADDAGYADSRWLTFKQAKQAKGSVRKGEKGTEIVYVNYVFREDRADPSKQVKIPFLKSYFVFNVAQCDGLELEATDKPAIPRPGERDAILDAFLASTGATVRHGGDRAFYTTAGDYVQMPPFAAFHESDGYYATLFHELGHWTGAPSRLNRQFGKRFGDRAYAAEELVAELTSAFVCAEFGIDMGDVPAAYLASWVSCLKEHDRAIVAAASAASKAVEFMRGLAIGADDDESLPLAA